MKRCLKHFSYDERVYRNGRDARFSQDKAWITMQICFSSNSVNFEKIRINRSNRVFEILRLELKIRMAWRLTCKKLILEEEDKFPFRYAKIDAEAQWN